jgi:lipopolysaccharide/colanic/teichoic acid biosynthesis glycosyltransferase
VKRLFDIAAACAGLMCASPVLVPVLVLVWLQDWHSPFYVAPRVAAGGAEFSMIKIRSMVMNADRSGVDSTGANDRRITPVGHFVRRYKLDEVTQLWNVLAGDMSLVGPRPNVKRETELYTAEERRLLDVKPGITDFASIVFADEGDILKDQSDPDIAYNQLIRPGKSRLGLFYVDNHNIGLDVRLCVLTAVALFSRSAALAGVERLLQEQHAPEALITLSRRDRPLAPMPPPGALNVVTTRQ